MELGIFRAGAQKIAERAPLLAGGSDRGSFCNFHFFVYWLSCLILNTTLLLELHGILFAEVCTYYVHNLITEFTQILMFPRRSLFLFRRRHFYSFKYFTFEKSFFLAFILVLSDYIHD